jgi:hypothetical protein
MERLNKDKLPKDLNEVKAQIQARLAAIEEKNSKKSELDNDILTLKEEIKILQDHLLKEAYFENPDAAKGDIVFERQEKDTPLPPPPKPEKPQKKKEEDATPNEAPVDKTVSSVDNSSDKRVK